MRGNWFDTSADIVDETMGGELYAARMLFPARSPMLTMV